MASCVCLAGPFDKDARPVRLSPNHARLARCSRSLDHARERRRFQMRSKLVITVFTTAWLAGGALGAQEDQAPTPVADPAELAFEEGRWDDAIAEYREILA